jgi:hypothetical protein
VKGTIYIGFYEMEWSKKFLGKILDFCLLFIKEKSENNNRSRFEG